MYLQKPRDLAECFLGLRDERSEKLCVALPLEHLEAAKFMGVGRCSKPFYGKDEKENKNQPPSTNAIERLHEEFKRRIKTQTVLPSAETAAMLFWAWLASGQISMRKVDGWRTLAKTSIGQTIDLAA